MCICVGCKNKKKYGLYCYKHKRYDLVRNNIILINKFTKKTNDYLKKDILNTLENNNINKNNNIQTLKKKELFYLLINDIEYLKKIIKIQRCYLKYLYNSRGYIQNLDNSKNDLDFYTLEPISKIDIKYFCSYIDINNNLWCFDIRSIKQLFNSIEEKKKILNPYNRLEIPIKVNKKFRKLIKKLKKEKVNLEFKEEKIFSNEEKLKRNIVDIFAEISRNGYYMDINWFYELTNFGLKHLYKNLEDIWNYRAQLTIDVKKQISPPNGILYSYSINDIFKINNKYKLRKIIISDLNKIYSNCLDDSYKSLGYMYFIIGLSFVNKKCFDEHSNWISFSI
tara:strand:- start:638 stop:1648 length:1011 start_codon:yes stop_codon:yes gene_type:complete